MDLFPTTKAVLLPLAMLSLAAPALRAEEDETLVTRKLNERSSVSLIRSGTVRFTEADGLASNLAGRPLFPLRLLLTTAHSQSICVWSTFWAGEASPRVLDAIAFSDRIVFVLCGPSYNCHFWEVPYVGPPRWYAPQPHHWTLLAVPSAREPDRFEAKIRYDASLDSLSITLSQSIESTSRSCVFTQKNKEWDFVAEPVSEQPAR